MTAEAEVCAGCGKNPGPLPFRANVAPGVSVVLCPGRGGSREPRPGCARRAAVDLINVCRGCGGASCGGASYCGHYEDSRWRGLCKRCATDLKGASAYAAERHVFLIDSAALYGATTCSFPSGVDARHLVSLVAGVASPAVMQGGGLAIGISSNDGSAVVDDPATGERRPGIDRSRLTGPSVRTTHAQALAAGDLLVYIARIVQAAYSEGHRNGSSVLGQLAAGEIGVSELDAVRWRSRGFLELEAGRWTPYIMRSVRRDETGAARLVDEARVEFVRRPEWDSKPVRGHVDAGELPEWLRARCPSDWTPFLRTLLESHNQEIPA